MKWRIEWWPSADSEQSSRKHILTTEGLVGFPKDFPIWIKIKFKDFGPDFQFHAQFEALPNGSNELIFLI